MEEEPKSEPRENRDPITGERGAHPLGTGFGTTGGAVAGAAIGTAIGGPVGGVAGTVVGGVIDAYGGRSVAEAVNPTEEEQYWRENHPRQPCSSSDFDYEHTGRLIALDMKDSRNTRAKNTKKSRIILRSITRRTQLAPHCHGTARDRRPRPLGTNSAE